MTGKLGFEDFKTLWGDLTNCVVRKFTLLQNFTAVIIKISFKLCFIEYDRLINYH